MYVHTHFSVLLSYYLNWELPSVVQEQILIEQQFKQVINAQFDVFRNLALHSAVRIFMYSVTSMGGLTQTSYFGEE